MLTSFIAHECARTGVSWKVREGTPCPDCGLVVSIEVAPWSYEELIGGIGLEAMHRQTTEFALRNGMPMQSKQDWIAGSLLVTLTPSMFIRALQASVVMTPAGVRVAPAPGRPMVLEID